MTVSPTVSVLLPCHNAGASLDAAVRSLLAQTHADLEVVAVDDGSTDGTAEQLRAWARRDARMRVLQQEHGGIVTALARAAGQARGPLLARMDADDVAAAVRLERQVEYLESAPELAACGTGVRSVPRRRLRAGARRYEEWINSVVTPEDMRRDIFIECPIAHPTLMIRREVYVTVGGYRDVPWPEDYDLILRLWAAGYQLGKVAEPLLEWREGDDRLSRTDARYSPDAFRRCKAHYFRHRAGDRPVVVWGAGRIGKAFASALEREGHLVAAFVDVDPNKVGQLIHGAPVLAPDALPGIDGAYVVAAVGSVGAREQIMAALGGMGFLTPDGCCAVA